MTSKDFQDIIYKMGIASEPETNVMKVINLLRNMSGEELGEVIKLINEELINKIKMK